jgi:hypothetical protein
MTVYKRDHDRLHTASRTRLHIQPQLAITHSDYNTACIPAGRNRRHGMARQARHTVLVLVALACAAGAAAQGGELHLAFLSDEDVYCVSFRRDAHPADGPVLLVQLQQPSQPFR